jgi:hypothetical protein
LWDKQGNAVPALGIAGYACGQDRREDQQSDLIERGFLKFSGENRQALNPKDGFSEGRVPNERSADH